MREVEILDRTTELLGKLTDEKREQLRKMKESAEELRRLYKNGYFVS